MLTARTGKVSQTSILMDMTASKISRLLCGLEEELGYPLFDKSKNPLFPTPRCQQLLAVLEPVLRDFQELQEPTFGLRKKTLIRVAAPIEANLDFYCFDYIRYAEANKQVEFEILPECTEQDVREGRVDVAMLNHVPDDTSEFKIRQIATTTTFPLATPEYLRRFGVPKKLDDLFGSPFSVFPYRSKIMRALDLKDMVAKSNIFRYRTTETLLTGSVFPVFGKI